VQRITIAELINNEWFKKGYQPPRFETADVNLDDVNSIFDESGVSFLHHTVHISVLSHNSLHGQVKKKVAFNAGASTACC
jgi:hypothetical protein